MLVLWLLWYLPGGYHLKIEYQIQRDCNDLNRFWKGCFWTGQGNFWQAAREVTRVTFVVVGTTWKWVCAYFRCRITGLLKLWILRKDTKEISEHFEHHQQLRKVNDIKVPPSTLSKFLSMHPNFPCFDLFGTLFSGWVHFCNQKLYLATHYDSWCWKIKFHQKDQGVNSLVIHTSSNIHNIPSQRTFNRSWKCFTHRLCTYSTNFFLFNCTSQGRQISKGRPCEESLPLIRKRTGRGAWNSKTSPRNLFIAASSETERSSQKVNFFKERSKEKNGQWMVLSSWCFDPPRCPLLKKEAITERQTHKELQETQGVCF